MKYYWIIIQSHYVWTYFCGSAYILGYNIQKFVICYLAPIEDQTYKTILEVVIKIITMYKVRRFVVKFILLDNGCYGLSVSLLKQRLLLNGTAANKHVPEIERLIRTIKERHRGKVNILLYKISKLPKLLNSYSVLQSVMWLNMFPRKGGISNTINPHDLVGGRQLEH